VEFEIEREAPPNLPKGERQRRPTKEEAVNVV
jgi:hypothetical protein